MIFDQDGRHAVLRDDEAEKALVGSLLIDPRRMADVVRIVRPEHFFDGLYRAVYEAAAELHRRQQLVEVVQVLQMVRQRRDVSLTEEAAIHIADAGIFVDHVTQSTVTSAHAVLYARMVAQTGLRRDIAALASDVPTATDAERAEKFQRMLSLERELNSLDTDLEGPKTLADECLRYLDQLASHATPLVQLGLPGIDYAISGGAAFGEMIVIGARPSQGKTMCAMQILEFCAKTQKLPGLIVSEEMSSQLLAGRSLLHQTEIAEKQWKHRMAELIADTEGFFAGRASISISKPCGTVKAAAQQIDQAAARGVKVVAVDYAQLLKGKGLSRYEQVTNVSMELKQAATRNNVLLILLCQLSRPGKERAVHKEADKQSRGVMPTMTDLRDSGQIEQDADVILFLQWPLKTNPAYKPYDRYFIYVEKNRNRAIEQGEVQCRIVPSRQLLEPLGTPQSHDPEYRQPYKEFEEWG